VTEGDHQPINPFVDELKIKLRLGNNRVAGFIAGVLEEVERSFPGRAIEEVERLRHEATDAAEAISLVGQSWQETQPLRDARAARTAELAAAEPQDLSTPEGMADHPAPRGAKLDDRPARRARRQPAALDRRHPGRRHPARPGRRRAGARVAPGRAGGRPGDPRSVGLGRPAPPRRHRQHRHVNQSEAEARATAAGEAPSASGHPAGAAVPQHGHHEGTPPAPAGRPHAALAPDASITLDQLIQAVRASFDEGGVPITEATLLAWLASAAWYAGAFDPEPVAVQTQHLEHIEEVACVLHDQQAGGRW
jgi:hypothetical protein